MEAGVIWLADKAPLEYDGPRDPGTLWNGGDSPFVDRRMVTVSRARVPGIRPIFPSWAAEIDIDYDDTSISISDLQNFARRAGRVGVGDYRRFYGRYTATISR